jgi:hypothetical protein
MTRIASRWCAVASVVVMFVTGCARVSPGEPVPVGTQTSTPSGRPREISLDGVDPCTLLPRSDYAAFELYDRPGKPSKDKHGGDTCSWQGEGGYNGVTVVTYEGVEAQQGRYGQIEPTDPIEDFPTYDGSLPHDDKACFVFVDVADGQYLEMQVGLDFAPSDRPTCDYAHDFATSIMSTLVKR